jgi:hypothetical protein
MGQKEPNIYISDQSWGKGIVLHCHAIDYVIYIWGNATQIYPFPNIAGDTSPNNVKYVELFQVPPSLIFFVHHRHHLPSASPIRVMQWLHVVGG